MSALSLARLYAHDAESFREIRLAALRDSPDSFGSTYETEAARPLAAFAERLSTSTVFGARLGPDLIGIGGLSRSEGPRQSHKGFVWGLYVRPEARGRHAGAALLDALLQEADDLVEQVLLSVVRGNEAARLYTSRGFAIYGTEPRALKTATGYLDEDLMIRFRPMPGRDAR